MSDARITPTKCMAPGCTEWSSVIFPDPDSPSGDGCGYVCHDHAEELAGGPLDSCGHVVADLVEPDPFGTPDFLIPASERWDCPCGYYSSGPVHLMFGSSIQTKCPYCGLMVEHVDGSPAGDDR